jgi:hypothetical protein
MALLAIRGHDLDTAEKILNECMALFPPIGAMHQNERG